MLHIFASHTECKPRVIMVPFTLKEREGNAGKKVLVKQPSKEKANSEDEWEVDDDSEDGSGSDSSGEEPGEEVAAEDSQASNSDASKQVDSEAS